MSLIALMFAGCSGNAADGPPFEPGATVEPSPATEPAPVVAPEPAAEVTFEYSTLDLEKCERTQEYEEAESVSMRCPGLREYPVFVNAGDLRYDTDFGVANAVWETRPGFNELGGTVEWRLREGTPFAAILRYIEEGPDGQKSEYLGVFKVGTAASPGCLIDWVGSTATPSQNDAARAMADSRAATFACPTE